MASDLFSGLVKGIGAFMPKDDPNTILFQTKTEISDLENRISELYAEIGKKAYGAVCNDPEYSELVAELGYTKKKLDTARQELNTAQETKAMQEQHEKEEMLGRTCPNCETLNPEGVKFCQECGARLNQSTKVRCAECGTEHPAGTRFCGECGSQL